jgi:hypothetical protein
MVWLTFRLPSSSREFDVELEPETFQRLLEELQYEDPGLADAVELAGRGEASRLVILREGDDELLAIAARVLQEKHLLDDPALATLASL